MIQIAYRSRHQLAPMLRQTDDALGTHRGMSFVLDQRPTNDWLAVCDDIAAPEPTWVPKARRILFVTEPPGIKYNDPAFTNQFGIAVSPFRLDGFGGRWIESQSGLPWFYGAKLAGGTFVPRLMLADLRSMSVPAHKHPRLSVVCSKKSKLPKHRERLAFLEKLKAALPDRVDIFGNGFNPVVDKAEAIDTYRYHLVLENNDIPHFWTEKLADAYLGFALPVFSGCANVTDYFSEASMLRLPPLQNHRAAITTITELLDRDPWAANLPAIQAARNKLLDDYNVFSVMTNIVTSRTSAERIPRLQNPEMLNQPPRVFNGTLGPARKAIHSLMIRLK
jgi:Glycosyltransferase family 10 (fucosyltransferase) C-term